MFGVMKLYERNRKFGLGWILVPIVALIVLAGLFVGFALLGSKAGVSYAPGPYYGWWFGGPFFGFGGFFFIPLIFIAFFAFRWFIWRPWGWGRGWYGGYYDDPALETLRQRFARGEITKEQFEHMSKDLQQ
jgi:putative membrane protein